MESITDQVLIETTVLVLIFMVLALCVIMIAIGRRLTILERKHNIIVKKADYNFNEISKVLSDGNSKDLDN